MLLKVELQKLSQKTNVYYIAIKCGQCKLTLVAKIQDIKNIYSVAMPSTDDS